jgi:indole-3-glycerol phosphate synthase
MILDDIAESTRKRVALARKEIPIELLKEQALSSPFPPSFEEALSLPGISFICEVKQASPSKGIIARDFPYLQIAREYEAAGAAAISVLTEPDYFLGRDAYLREIAQTLKKIPVLRKDFTIDAYQIYEAKALGASAVLLICALLDEDTLSSFIECARHLGLSALVEAHTEEEIAQALRAGARIIGVNNRNLKTFQVDLTTSIRLRGLVPPDRFFVSESGIHSRGDIQALEACGVHGVLIGEALMSRPDKKAALMALRI